MLYQPLRDSNIPYNLLDNTLIHFLNVINDVKVLLCHLSMKPHIECDRYGHTELEYMQHTIGSVIAASVRTVSTILAVSYRVSDSSSSVSNVMLSSVSATYHKTNSQP